jgi:hypothetical protein
MELVLAGKPERAVLRRLLELYRDDFSELNGADVGQHGGFALAPTRVGGNGHRRQLEGTKAAPASARRGAGRRRPPDAARVDARDGGSLQVGWRAKADDLFLFSLEPDGAKPLSSNYMTK